jgi:disulfide bond formation protein DsbB
MSEKPSAYPAIQAFAGAVLALGMAYVSQYGFGKLPCHLCLYQRVPYWVVIGLAPLALALRGRRGLYLAALAGAALAFLADAGIAFFHVGVEQHWWAGLGGCTVPPMPRDPEALWEWFKLRDEIVDCSKPQVVVLGLSMAAWNCAYALVLFTATALGTWSCRKPAGR